MLIKELKRLKIGLNLKSGQRGFRKRKKQKMLKKKKNPKKKKNKLKNDSRYTTFYFIF